MLDRESNPRRSSASRGRGVRSGARWLSWVLAAYLLSAFLLSAFLLSAAHAQTNDEAFGELRFNLEAPGARSLAMGGAFVGLADDATAAFANPAGLLWLMEPEVSLEGRFSRARTRFLDGGRIECEPSGIGLDTADRPLFSEFEDESVALGFLSYARPARSRRWAFSVFAHQPATVDLAVRSEGAFNGEVRVRPDGSVTSARIAPILGAVDIDIRSLGVALALRAREGLWLGMALARHEMTLTASTRRFDPRLEGDGFGPSQYSPESEFLRREATGDDHDLTLTAGVLWRPGDGDMTLGLVYRRGAEFAMSSRFTWGPLAVALGGDDPEEAAALSGATGFRTPSVLGLGVSWRASDRFLVSVELDRVEFSRLEPRRNVLLSVLRRDGVELADFRVEDVLEPRLGFEYVFLSPSPVSLAVRWGAWLEPDHGLRFEGPTEGNEDLMARFRGGDEALHGTLGLGVVWGGGRRQVDLAVDVAETGEVATLSCVVRF